MLYVCNWYITPFPDQAHRNIFFPFKKYENKVYSVGNLDSEPFQSTSFSFYEIFLLLDIIIYWFHAIMDVCITSSCREREMHIPRGLRGVGSFNLWEIPQVGVNNDNKKTQKTQSKPQTSCMLMNRELRLRSRRQWHRAHLRPWLRESQVTKSCCVRPVLLLGAGGRGQPHFQALMKHDVCYQLASPEMQSSGMEETNFPWSRQSTEVAQNTVRGTVVVCCVSSSQELPFPNLLCLLQMTIPSTVFCFSPIIMKS